VQFSNLGFVVIDEQHRFGVEQRARLWTKNLQPPHILVMTATPIPRTLAMTLYGDLDVSVIDELPPGRRPIKTFHYTDAARLKLFGFMRQEIAKGRQVYVVYPLIKESEAMDYKDLTGRLRSHLARLPAAAVRHGDLPRQDEARRQGGVDAPVQTGRSPHSRGHVGDRGGRRRAQRDGHGDRVGRSVSGFRSSTSCAGAWAAAASSPTAS